MIRVKTTPVPATGLELTPLIDIVFIVVVFLLLTANTRLLSLPVEIPSSDSPAETATATASVLTITLQPTPPIWAINDQLFDSWQEFKPALLAKLSQMKPLLEPKIHVAPARDAEVEPLVKLLSLLNEQQVENTQILMKEQDHD
ncbi:ExbD/TolR family protein [Microbulbifer sp. TYP-18]|uniref:ExbD/TolR family protein n=1 Tax=Microbulbifer sp. TYP-18 TaxID=3230024 RepID=UPI0034C5C7A0